MPVLRFDASPESRISIAGAMGDLQVRGSDRAEIRVDSQLEADYVPEEVEGMIQLPELDSNAIVYVPNSTRLIIGRVHSSLDIRNVFGSIQVQRVASDCLLRSVADVTITEGVAGSLNARDLHGILTVSDISGDGYIRNGVGVTIADTVSGTLQVRDMNGPVTIDTVAGDLTARDITGELVVNRVDSDTNLRDIRGSISLGKIAGTLVMRDVQDTVHAERVRGGLIGRDVDQGLEIGQVGGDLALRTDFAPSSLTRLEQVSGSVTLRIPERTSARFFLKAGGGIRASSGITLTEEGDQTIAMTGDGQAQVHITAGGSIMIKGGRSTNIDEEFTAAFEVDLGEDWDDISERINERIESKLEGLPDRIRGRVEAKLKSAQHHIYVAQRKTEEAVRRAERAASDDAPGVVFGFGSSQSKAGEPVSEQERLAILNMLEKGTITVEQAQELLSALEG